MVRARSPFDSLCKDREVLKEIAERWAGRDGSRPRHWPNSLAESTFERAIGVGNNGVLWLGRRLPEAIILSEGRPSLLIRDGRFDEPTLQVWKQRLEPHRPVLERVIPSVGRVEVVGHPDYAWLGTAWVVDDRVVITNRHVAALFSRSHGRGFRFVKNPLGATIGARINFRAEHEHPDPLEIAVDRVLYLSEVDPEQPDLAFLRLRTHDPLPPPLSLASQDPEAGMAVALIGHPALDTRNAELAMSRIFQNIFDVKRLSPGYVMGNLQPHLFGHDCTSLGGSSGSPIVRVETGEVVGLHVSGRYRVANYAVPVSAIRRALTANRSQVSLSIHPPVRRLRRVEDYRDREGYNERFLGRSRWLRVPLPALSAAMLDDAVQVSDDLGLASRLLRYTHFSLVMSRSRRLAFYVAVNIDGGREVKIGKRRPGWRYDPRIPRAFQVGDEVYAGRNMVSRGHLVRRIDPAWGDADTALQANDDTFHFTNAAPQQQAFNEKEWGDLEDYLLFNAQNTDVKLTVFTGPVFDAKNRRYRGVEVPTEFWKVAVMAVPQPGPRLLATAYLASQASYLDRLEFVPGAYRHYQTTIRQIERKTGLDFGRLRDHDPLEGAEATADQTFVPIRTAADLVLGPGEVRGPVTDSETSPDSPVRGCRKRPRR
jgi:endonuclease G